MPRLYGNKVKQFTPTPATKKLNGLVLYAQGASVADTSGTSKVLTAYGDASANATGGPVDGGYYSFDGTGDYIATPNTTDLALDGNKWAISLFVYADTNLNMTALGKANAGTYATFAITIYSYNWRILIGSGSNSWAIVASLGAVTTEQWVHIALAYDGTNVYMYLDGVLTSTNALSSMWDNTESVTIGSRNGSGFWNGDVGDVQIVNGDDRGWTGATIDVPEAPLSLTKNTVSLLHGADLLDYSGNGHAVTAVGNASANNSGNPFGFGASFDFDGTGDSLTIAQSTDFNVVDNKFAIDGWMYPTVETRQWIMHRATTDYWLAIDFHNLGTRNICIWASSNGTSWDLINADSGGNGIGTISLPLNAWSHFAFRRTSANLWSSYINGVRDVNVTVAGSVIDASEDIVIGRHATASLDLNAKLAEINFRNGTDNGWTGATIDVPTSPYKVV